MQSEDARQIPAARRGRDPSREGNPRVKDFVFVSCRVSKTKTIRCPKRRGVVAGGWVDRHNDPCLWQVPRTWKQEAWVDVAMVLARFAWPLLSGRLGREESHRSVF